MQRQEVASAQELIDSEMYGAEGRADGPADMDEHLRMAADEEAHSTELMPEGGGALPTWTQADLSSLRVFGREDSEYSFSGAETRVESATGHAYSSGLVCTLCLRLSHTARSSSVEPSDLSLQQWTPCTISALTVALIWQHFCNCTSPPLPCQRSAFDGS